MKHHFDYLRNYENGYGYAYICNILALFYQLMVRILIIKVQLRFGESMTERLRILKTPLIPAADGCIAHLVYSALSP